MAFVNGKGEAVTPDPERATGEERHTVTLAPGAGAWCTLTYANPAVTECGRDAAATRDGGFPCVAEDGGLPDAGLAPQQ